MYIFILYTELYRCIVLISPSASFSFPRLVSGEGREKVVSDDRGRNAAGELGAEVSADGFGWKSRRSSVGSVC